MVKEHSRKGNPTKTRNIQKDDSIKVFGRPRKALAKKLKLNLRFPTFVIAQPLDMEKLTMGQWHLRLPTQEELENNKDGFFFIFSNDLIHAKEEYLQGKDAYIHPTLWLEIMKKFNSEFTVRDSIKLCVEFFLVQCSISMPKCFNISDVNKKKAA